MKRLFTLLIFTLLISIVPASFAQAPTVVTFTWGFAYNTAYPQPCSTTLTVNCVQSFVLRQGTTTVATIPATSATSYSYDLTTLPAAGTYTYTLVAVGAYQGGTIESSPATVSLQVPSQPPTATGFTVTLH